MDKSTIIEKINEFLIEEFELEEGQLTPEAHLKDDLDIESLDFVDIAVILENMFGVKVTSEHLGNILTLDNLYDFVSEHSSK